MKHRKDMDSDNSKDNNKHKNNNSSNGHRYLWLIFTLILLALAGLLELLARKVPDFAPFYSTTFYQFFQGSISKFPNLFPFSLSELLLYALPIAFIVTLIIKLTKRKSPIRLFKISFVIISALLLIYQLNCGINYHNTSFAIRENFKTDTADIDALDDFCAYIGEKLIENSNIIKENYPDMNLENSDDQIIFYQRGNELQKNAVSAMEHIGSIYPSLNGYYPRPKSIINSRIFSNMGVTGIYSPFTIEANYNREMTPYNLPFTLCHELSHLRGYMDEKEANFIGFLACVNSDDLAFQRSGYMMAWVYAGNQLYKVNSESYINIRDSLPYDVRKELTDNNDFWNEHETKASDIQDALNDEYLKINGIPEGIKSYDRVVELMLSWYKKQTDHR